jgi:putative glutamine amidotransferase
MTNTPHQKPLVGITTTRLKNSFGNPIFTINEPYTQSISAAGGLPVLIPLDLSQDDQDALLTRLDGVLFTGGYDVDPQLYGCQVHPKVEGVDSRRDQVEMHLLYALLKMRKPFFGICRGLQLINVALGGSLYADLPEQFPGAERHENHDLPRNHMAHSVNLAPDSSLVQVLNTRQPQVNSLHHQGVRRLAQDLHPAAHAPDGLLEAFELPGHPFGIAVQWHPEELQKYESQRRLFQAFVQACREDNS